MKYLFYIAPPFASFAGDIMRELARKDTSAEFYAISAYGKREVQVLESRLGRPLDGWSEAMSKQQEWIKTPATDNDHTAFLARYGQEVFTRTLIADRFIAKGYVSGGTVKPHPEIDGALKNEKFGATNYVIGLYRFVDEIMDEVQPDLVFSYVVANSIAFSMAKSAEAHGVRFAQIKPARIGQRYIIDTSVKDSFSLVHSHIENLRTTDLKNEIFDQACEWLNDFREKKLQPEYHVENTRRMLSRKSWKVYAEAAFQIVNHGFRYALDRYEGRRKKIARALMRIRIEHRYKHDMRKYLGGTLPGAPFVYYPLHVDPEASTMVLAPYHTDQLSVIEGLSKALPPGELLVVKEHLPMVGRRPAGFYARISAMHNVVLLGPLCNGVEVLKRSNSVVVITGTAGWEGLCLGIPVLVIGDAPYTLIGEGLCVEQNLAELSTALTCARCQQPASDEALVRYIQAIFDHSFEMPAKTIFGGYSEVPPEVTGQASADIATHIEKLLGVER
ncbi:MAG: hypothetical protein ABJF50_16940 [Paracoccaceae bacterium]|uniref:capsular polysaccharide export protein, LipB/KpsS family n=2 Tax=Pseudomonadota TaxID=1224 RepID=UPI0032645C68